MQFDQLKRREFITLLGGAAAAQSILWPLAARAQQPAKPVIGFLSSTAEAPLHDQVAAFREGIKESGYVEGQNVAIDYRWAEGQYDRLPAMAADLVVRGAAVIVALAQPAAAAAKAATSAVPIVFVMGADPVKLGLVKSLSRPGGNVTGVSFLINALGGKRLQVIRELVPTASTIGLLVNVNDPGSEPDRQDVQQVAGTLGQKLRVLNAGNGQDLEAAFATMVREQISALIVSPDALFTSRRDQIVELAARHAVPTIYYLREAVAAGGLMSYGTSLTDAHRLAGAYTGRILKGARADELPVQQSTKFEFVINLKTAKTLGLTVPPSLLATADEVIE
jgi:putative ABC transport system substrate-binding protein